MTHDPSWDHPFDPDRDLLLEREVPVPADAVWRAWTDPEQVKRWFTPRPWQTADCEIDLRPGGIFRTVMRSPEGDEHPSNGCWLEVDPGRRLVFTNLLGPGFRPLVASAGAEGAGGLFFTAVITLVPTPDGTRYSARVIHGDPETCARHAEMGFHDGWGAALDQLVEVASAAAPLG